MGETHRSPDGLSASGSATRLSATSALLRTPTWPGCGGFGISCMFLAAWYIELERPGATDRLFLLGVARLGGLSFGGTAIRHAPDHRHF
jgi:hypothetical protein